MFNFRIPSSLRRQTDDLVLAGKYFTTIFYNLYNVKNSEKFFRHYFGQERQEIPNL